MNIVPTLDEDGTEFNSQKMIVIDIGRKYHRPGRGRDGIQFSETKHHRPWTIILSTLDDDIIGLDEVGTEFNSREQNIIDLGR